jgi:hypothetical protein
MVGWSLSSGEPEPAPAKAGAPTRGRRGRAHLGLIADGLPTDDIEPDERHALAERSTTRCEPLQSAAPSPGAIIRPSAGSSGRAAG